MTIAEEEWKDGLSRPHVHYLRPRFELSRLFTDVLWLRRAAFRHEDCFEESWSHLAVLPSTVSYIYSISEAGGDAWL